MSKQLTFSEHTTSRLVELFQQKKEETSGGGGGDGDNNDETTQQLYNNVEKYQPTLSLSQSRSITLNELQREILNKCPNIDSVELDKSVLDQLDNFKYDNIEQLRRTLDTLPAENNQSCCINLIKVSNFENVKVNNASVDVKTCNFFPPRFRINVGNVAPNSSVCINTGYIITMPEIAKQYRIIDGVIKTDAKSKSQPNFVVVPHFFLNNTQKNDIIPCMYSRDPEDTGLFTISFTTRSGNVGNLMVILRAFATSTQIANDFYITKSESSETTTKMISKPKDFKNGRYTANLKIKFDASTMCVQKNNNRQVGLFKTFNTDTNTLHEHQRLVFDSRNAVLFSSRKREWFNRHLTTFSGILTRKSHTIPYVALADVPQATINNTHCCTLLESKRSLFSTIQDCSDITTNIGALKLLNGAFANIDKYDSIKKSLRQLVKGLSGLHTGVKQCRRMLENDTRLASRMHDLLKLYDYHHIVTANDKLFDHLSKTDCEMFQTQLTASKPYSVFVYQAMCQLIYTFYHDVLDTESLKILMQYTSKLDTPTITTTTTAAVAVAASIDDDADGHDTTTNGDVPPLKRQISEDESIDDDDDNNAKRQKI